MNNKYQLDKNARFLVTGGAGFIGSNLSNYLIEQGYYVRCLDNFSTGKRKNIQELLDHEQYDLLKGDIRNIETCHEACKDIDYVLHQGALGSVPRSIKDPATSVEVNVNGALNMMIAARDAKVKRFVYASSSSVYGDEPNLPKKEGREGKLLSPYAFTKAANEECARLFYELYKLPVVGLRYFNVFGRNQDPDSIYAAVIPIFVKMLINNEPPTINGDGETSRDFTHVSNVIEANLKACVCGEDALGRAYNIAYGGRVTLNTLYHQIAQALGKDIQPIYGSERAGDIKHSNADISDAKTLLNYLPQCDFETGLKQTITWYVENL